MKENGRVKISALVMQSLVSPNQSVPFRLGLSIPLKWDEWHKFHIRMKALIMLSMRSLSTGNQKSTTFTWAREIFTATSLNFALSSIRMPFGRFWIAAFLISCMNWYQIRLWEFHIAKFHSQIPEFDTRIRLESKLATDSILDLQEANVLAAYVKHYYRNS